ncbi:vacuolar iron transporter homolog 4-like [Dioscorea cayenensis subsp. rotundata]|uniref:Vacuolar iron transporter n=1 Tax=Dioscorea cayennensis subsp. rotundata TaxID=55577 RepID=A0AB40AQ07_DIOCR|nr:vacuolar iron transporter homolog 4-like [Dioscorea cayenensis subsp. rotundata]
MATNETKITIEGKEQVEVNYSQRAQWLRAAVLGANDGLVSTASLMMGVGAVKDDPKAMLISGFAGLVAGACSMAIGEFVSVYSQVDIEVAEMKRNGESKHGDGGGVPSPVQAAVASGMAFSVGAAVPLLAAGFITQHSVRLGVVAAAASLALVMFGLTGAVLGRAPVVRSTVRVLAGGWMAMGVTFGLMKLFGSSAAL